MVVEYSLLLLLWSSSLDSSLVSNLASLLVLSLPFPSRFLCKASLWCLKSANRIWLRPTGSSRPSVSLESSHVVGVVVEAVLFSSTHSSLVSSLVNLSLVNPSSLVYPCLVKFLLSKFLGDPKLYLRICQPPPAEYLNPDDAVGPGGGGVGGGDQLKPPQPPVPSLG